LSDSINELNLVEVKAKADKLDDGEKIVFYNDCNLTYKNIIEDIKLFLSIGELNILTDEKFDLARYLRSIGKRVKSMTHDNILKMIKREYSILMNISNKIDLEIEAVKLRRAYHMASIMKNPADHRIFFFGTEEQLMKLFELLMDLKLIVVDCSEKRDFIFSHFQIQGGYTPKDMDKYKDQPIRWIGRHTKFVCLWNKLIEAGFLTGDEFNKYQQISGHIVNRENLPFIDLSNKYNNIKHKTPFREIQKVITQVVELGNSK